MSHLKEAYVSHRGVLCFSVTVICSCIYLLHFISHVWRDWGVCLSYHYDNCIILLNCYYMKQNLVEKLEKVAELLLSCIKLFILYFTSLNGISSGFLQKSRTGVTKYTILYFMYKFKLHVCLYYLLYKI